MYPRTSARPGVSNSLGYLSPALSEISICEVNNVHMYTTLNFIVGSWIKKNGEI